MVLCPATGGEIALYSIKPHLAKCVSREDCAWLLRRKENKGGNNVDGFSSTLILANRTFSFPVKITQPLAFLHDLAAGNVTRGTCPLTGLKAAISSNYL